MLDNQHCRVQSGRQRAEDLMDDARATGAGADHDQRKLAQTGRPGDRETRSEERGARSEERRALLALLSSLLAVSPCLCVSVSPCLGGLTRNDPARALAPPAEVRHDLDARK